MATVSFQNMDQAFSTLDSTVTAFSALDGVNAGFLYSYQSTGGDDWEIGGTGITNAGGGPTGGTVTSLQVDLDNDGGGAEFSITGLNVAATSLGVNSGGANAQRDKFWGAVLGGADTVNFTMASYVSTVTFAGDGANVTDGLAHVGANDIFVAAPQSLGSASTILGDYGDIISGSAVGGADSFFVGALFLYGDFRDVGAGVTATGGADTITPTRIGGNLPSLLSIAGDAFNVSGVLNGGNDFIDLRSTDFTGYTKLRTKIVGDVFSVSSGGTLNGGADVIHGSFLGDDIYGDELGNAGTSNGGADNIYGYAGADLIFAGGGDDYVNGGADGDAINGGAGNDTLDGGDGFSLTANEGAIFRIYQATLGRAPDEGGFDYWTAQYGGGVSLLTITTGFVQSTEFQQTYGSVNDSQFVTLLYNNVLNRAPDQAGLNYWTGQLGSGASREFVVLNFSESQEFKNATVMSSSGFATATAKDETFGQVFRVYQATLDRAPDEGGFIYWTGQLAADQADLLTLVTGFVQSTEFQQTYGALNNSQFVTLLYNNVLNRAPDQAGLNYWTGQLASGVSREVVVLNFSESQEFKNATDSSVVSFMKTSLPTLSDELTGGAGDDVMLGGAGEDQFIFVQGAGGADTIYGFDAYDILALTGFGYANAAAALSHFSQVGADVVFQDQGQTITFADTGLTVIQNAEFLLI